LRVVVAITNKWYVFLYLDQEKLSKYEWKDVVKGNKTERIIYS